MPSIYAEPTVQELLDAFEDGVRATKDRYVDAREGAIYQHWSGVAAILWSRNARRDTDLWRAIYLDSAEATDLTNLLADRYEFDRIADTYGTGTARLSRESVAAADGTIWTGTRILIGSSTHEPRRYVVLEDADVGATDTIANITVRAEKPGVGCAILFSSGDELTARVDDPLWDTTWTVEHLECADGTSFEPASAARARFRTERRAARAGFVTAIAQACKDAGAAYALLFPSDYAGDDEDVGLNLAYVGDAGHQGDAALVRAVTIALERWRVLGDNLQVRPLGRTNLIVRANIYLWTSPTRVDQDTVQKLLKGATLAYFDGASAGYSYNRDALAGALMKVCPYVQSVEFDLPASDAAVLETVGGRPNLPATLNRYAIAPDDITFTLLPPP